MASHDPEHLLAQARWVRALARELAGSAGEDVAQEAFVAALVQPTAGRNLAAWLAGVVRNLARRAQRAEAGRTRREQAAARPEALPASDELVAEGELQRRLAAAVMELEEPYRATVLLHYFRELPLVAIARHQGVPAATVRTRLRRALAQLRAELDRGAGGREAWALVALGGGTQGGLAAASAGGIGMGLKTTLAAAGTAALLGWLAWRELRPAAETELAHASPAMVGDEPAPVATQGSLPGPVLVESEPTVPRAAVPESPRFTEVLVHGSAFDARGEPVEAWVTLEDEVAELLSAEEALAGHWALSGVHPGRWKLRAGGRGLQRIERDLVVRADASEQRVDLRFEPAASILVRVLDEAGEDVEFIGGNLLPLVTRTAPISGRLGVRPSVHELFREASFLSREGEVGAVPPGYFAGFTLHGTLPVHVSLLRGHDVLATKRLDAPVETVTFELPRAQLDATLGGATGRFLDGTTCMPLPRVAAFLADAQTFVRYATNGSFSDDEGRFRIEGKVPAVLFLQGVLEGYALSTRCVRVRAGERLELGDIPLWPTTPLQGRAFGPDGRPSQVALRWSVQSETRSPLDMDSLRHARGSRFTLEVPRTRIWLWAYSNGLARSVRSVDASFGSVEGLELHLQQGTRVILRHGEESLGRTASLVRADGAPVDTFGLGRETLAVRLEPGAYELWTGDGDEVDRRTPFVVGSETMELLVPAPPK